MRDWTEYLYMVEGGQRCIELTPEQEATVLHLYDYGLEAITETEAHELNVILAKLKDLIHP